jgi:L-2-hydroxyglutarate oxidase
MSTYDVAIIGGGIVGLATAYRLTEQYPETSVVVLEKEDRVGAHQTRHNSGVIHSGIFYEPGSLKAENCREGKRALVEFCEREGIDYDMCGKVVVATDEREVPELERIQEKGRRNQVECTRIGPERLHELEPHVQGVAGLHVPEAGIVDYGAVADALARCVTERGHAVRTGAAVRDLHVTPNHVTVDTTTGAVQARHAVNCAGLYADRIAAMSGQALNTKIVPFRGEYYELVPERRSLCNNLIYPVPDPAFPFLGVHFTPMIDGRVECGPSAVLAFAREGYHLTDVNWAELKEILTYPGFQALAARHWQKGLRELLQSMSKRVYLQAARTLIPEVQMEDFTAPRAGVRAQALRRDGTLVDDFLIRETDRVVNVINAASPAATSALNIGTLIVENHLADRLTDLQVATESQDAAPKEA